MPPFLAIATNNCGLPASSRVKLPAKPKTAILMRLFMMIGWMLLIISAIWSGAFTGAVGAYFNHSVANELNPAAAGSALLNQFGLIKGTLPWFKFLRFAGMAFIMTAISIALTVIIRTLQHQEKAIRGLIKARA